MHPYIYNINASSSSSSGIRYLSWRSRRAWKICSWNSLLQLWKMAWVQLKSYLSNVLRTADTWSKCCCVQMQTGAGRVSRISLSIRVSHLLHVYRLFLHWMTPENAVVFQSSKENRPQKMPARPLEAKIVFVEQNSRLTLGSPSNNVKKSFVRWASHCVVCGPPVETERPARALKKKDVKKVQPVWLQVEQKREPVWLLLTFVNSFWLNSFLNSFWKFCTILTLLFLVPIFVATYVEAPQVQRWCRCCAMASEGNPSPLCLYPVLGWGSDTCAFPTQYLGVFSCHPLKSKVGVETLFSKAFVFSHIMPCQVWVWWPSMGCK